MKPLLLTSMKILLGLLFLAVLLVLGGVFARPGIAPAVLAAPTGEPVPAQVCLVERGQHPLVEWAVGTIASTRRVDLAARVSGQILALHAEVGQSVSAGELLAVLDGRDAQARVAQAQGVVAAAQARANQALAAAERTRGLFERAAATSAQREEAEAAAATADASLLAAREALAEAEVALGFVRITAPMAGVVAARPLDPGDLATPGLPIFTLIDPTSLRIEASVREGERQRIAPGQRLKVEVQSLGVTLEAQVEEVLPMADPKTRTFLVRAALPPCEGLYAGMFARLALELGQREIVQVSRHAVRTVGQLHTVLVRSGERWERRFVTLGAVDGEMVEILSGLVGGETVGFYE